MSKSCLSTEACLIQNDEELCLAENATEIALNYFQDMKELTNCLKRQEPCAKCSSSIM